MPKIPTYIAEGRPAVPRLPGRLPRFSPEAYGARAGEEITTLGERLGIIGQRLADQQAELDVSERMRSLQTGWTAHKIAVGDRALHPDQYAPTLLKDLGRYVKTEAEQLRSPRARYLFQLKADDFLAAEGTGIQYEGLKRQHALIETQVGVDLTELENEAVFGAPSVALPPALPPGASVPFGVPINRPDLLPVGTTFPGEAIDATGAVRAEGERLGLPLDVTLTEIKKVRVGNPDALDEGLRRILGMVARGIWSGEQGRAQLQRFAANIQAGEIRRDFADAGNRLILLKRLLAGTYYTALAPAEQLALWRTLSDEKRTEEDRQETLIQRQLAEGRDRRKSELLAKANYNLLTREDLEAAARDPVLGLDGPAFARHLVEVQKNPPFGQATDAVLALRQAYGLRERTLANIAETREKLIRLAEGLTRPDPAVAEFALQLQAHEDSVRGAQGPLTNQKIEMAKNHYVTLVGQFLPGRIGEIQRNRMAVDVATMSNRIRLAAERGLDIDPIAVATELWQQRQKRRQTQPEEDRIIEEELAK